MNNSGEFGGKSGKIMKLKKLRTRDDMSIPEEDYHTGASASVPFKWESEPGTPKANFPENGNHLSPLTPPPSYFSNHFSHSPLTLHSSSSSDSKPSPRSNFLNTVFRKLSVKAAATRQPLSPASSSSSSSFSSSFDLRVDDDDGGEEDSEENVEISPVSTLFFGRGRSANDQGCYPKLAKVFSRRDFK